MRRTFFLRLALFMGLFSYCVVLLISREGAIPLLTIGGIGALAITVISLGALWHVLSKPATN